ncbi:MAG: hypothetical protein HFJ49_03035 [Clostridia bacterium]|nr:hypothetical protein [Clostridia bacterium]
MRNEENNNEEINLNEQIDSKEEMSKNEQINKKEEKNKNEQIENKAEKSQNEQGEQKQEVNKNQQKDNENIDKKEIQKEIENIKKEKSYSKNVEKEENTETSKTIKETENNAKKSKIKKEKEKESLGKRIFKVISRIVVVGILLAIVAFALLYASRYYRDDSIKDRTNLVLNSNNVTAKLKEKIIIEDDIIYLSMKDIKNFLDYYIYEEKETEQIITTSDKNIAAIGFKDKRMTVNGTREKIDATAIKRDSNIYLPIAELSDVYEIEVKYIDETNTLTIDSLSRALEKATVTNKSSIKSHTKIFSRTIDKVEETEEVIIIKELDNGWTKVRTQRGKIGFIQTDKLKDFKQVREAEEEEKQIEGKINMFWDYYSEYASAPDRTGQKIQGINVVSPTFFYINEQGEFTEKVGIAGQKYIQWAKGNGYKVWAMLSNDIAGIKVTSNILNNYENRQELIEKIVEACKKYKLDGINIDFEFMYEKDKDVFSRFIIELTPRMKDIGVVTSVDVTAPDGSPNWSLCYDRYVLGKIADYLVFMGYDQYGTSSKSAGTTAGYDWIDLALKKFTTTYEVDSEKIILAMPLYTRIWTETLDGSVSSKVVNMKNIESNIPEGVQKVWQDDVKQYYVEFKAGSTTKKMWIEDEKSIKEKVSLVSQYNLAGVSCWVKDREIDTIWKVIDEELNNSDTTKEND